VSRAEELGYKWAYRVLDARSFGLPQRRERVVFILSRDINPEDILFPSGYIEPEIDDSVGPIDPSCLYGFYWTEGKRGLGWTRDGVPTIKGGSTIGIPSPPAIWDPKTGKFGTPSLRDAERLFGFPADWTKPAIAETRREGAQWKLIGNSICVPMVEWIASQVSSPKGLIAKAGGLEPHERMPMAAFGRKGKSWSVQVSTWARRAQSPKLRTFLKYPMKPLSEKAAKGFYKRALETRVIRFPDGFLRSLNTYIQDKQRGC